MPISLATISAICALVYGAYFTRKQQSTLKTAVKILSLGGLVVVAIIISSPAALIAALFFGTLGDGFLSREGNRCFVAGLGSFLTGHICYIWLFWDLGISITQYNPSPSVVAASTAFSIAAIALAVKINPHLGSLRFPVMAYIAISWILGLSTLLLSPHSSLILAIIGTILFILSDIILAFDLFVIDPKSQLAEYTSRVLWAFYWSGQTLILIGVAQATP